MTETTNITTALDDERDIIYDDETGDFVWSTDHDTTRQCVQNTLRVYNGDVYEDHAEWFLNIKHGAAYEAIFGVTPRPTDAECEAIIQSAIFQEPNIKSIDAISIEFGDGINDRSMKVKFRAKTIDGFILEDLLELP